MSILAKFNYDSQEIRFVGDMPVAIDVARVLGYARPDQAIKRHVFESNKTAPETGDAQTKGLILLKEAGIYQLIFRSKLPSAEKFQQWVFEEVLPSIRRTGGYSIELQQEAVFDSCLRLVMEGCNNDRERAERLILAYLAGAFDPKIVDMTYKIRSNPESPFLLDLQRHQQEATRKARLLFREHQTKLLEILDNHRRKAVTTAKRMLREYNGSGL